MFCIDLIEEVPHDDIVRLYVSEAVFPDTDFFMDVLMNNPELTISLTFVREHHEP